MGNAKSELHADIERPTTMRPRRRQPLQSVTRALLVLDALACRPGGVTPKRLSVDVGLHLSTVYHLLDALCHAGYAVRDPTTQLFRLGPRIPWLNYAFLSALSCPGWGADFLRTLRDATGETALLAQWWGDYVVVIDLLEGSRHQRVTRGYPGYISRPLDTAMGQVLLAFAPEERRNALLKQAGNASVVACRQKELARIRAVGYAAAYHCAAGSSDVGCIAAPVRCADGAVAYALGIIGPRRRIEPEEQPIARLVTSIARSASVIAAESDMDWPIEATAARLPLPAVKAVLDATLRDGADVAR